MPLPTPNSGESQDDFMSRCMGSDTMRSEYPDESQRAAICHRQFSGETSISASTAAEIKVIKQHDSGGGIVEIPLLVEHQKFDFSKTAGGGPKNGSITLDMLNEMAANFPLHPNVPIGVTPHVEYEDRAGLSPGFIDAVRVEGTELIGTCDLGPQLFDELVNKRGWRGFSVEAKKGLQMPARTIEGWTLTGGVFTNRASTDTFFKMAAEADSPASVELQTYRPLNAGTDKEDQLMADTDKALGRLEAEAKVKDDRIATLQTDLQNANERNATLKKDAVEYESRIAQLNADLKTEQAKANRHEADAKDLQARCTKLQTELNEAQEKVKEIENADLSERVVKAIEACVQKGMKPANFDGHEKDPVAWLQNKWAGRIDALENMAASLPESKDAPATSSGKPAADAASEKMTEERKEELRKLGLDPDKAVASEEELLALQTKKTED